VRTCLLKAGDYRLVAVYTNSTDSYFDHRLRKKVKLPGKVWKNTLKSQDLAIKITGTVKPPPKGGPRLRVAH
jgi:hypothetical protein